TLIDSDITSFKRQRFSLAFFVAQI
ncbi:hypothetical protein D046_6184B, partial [Vibrio parahaemolyticus V-223/04]